LGFGHTGYWLQISVDVQSDIDLLETSALPLIRPFGPPSPRENGEKVRRASALPKNFFSHPEIFHCFATISSLYARHPESHVPFGVPRRKPEKHLKAGKVFSWFEKSHGRLIATTVRATLVSAGCPKAGVIEEAHPHCRQGGEFSNPRQTKRTKPKAEVQTM
jgi:hypothetical protein